MRKEELIILIILGGLGYYVYSRGFSNQKTSQITSQVNTVLNNRTNSSQPPSTPLQTGYQWIKGFNNQWQQVPVGI